MVHAANIQDWDGVQPALIETEALCPDVSYAWADQSYRGDLVEWAAKVLGITIEIVTRPADQVGCQVQPRRWVVEIVFTQMTKTDVFAGRGRGNDVADLHVAIGHDHSVDQEQHHLPFLLKCGNRQAFLDPLTKGIN